jgi:hypothetical protein
VYLHVCTYVLLPQRVRPAITADPGEGHDRRAVRVAPPPSTGRAVRSCHQLVALQLRQPRRPVPQCLRGGGCRTRDHQQQAVSFATDLCHGLDCKRSWRRVMRRHNGIRDSLARPLKLGFFVEPPADRRRATWATRPPPGEQPRGFRGNQCGEVRRPAQLRPIQFIVETGGYINRRAHLFLDTPAADSRTQGTSGDRHPTTSRSGG